MMNENMLFDEPGAGALEETPAVESKPAGGALTLEIGLYFVALLVALIFRLAMLGSLPLSETEANYAWQAYQVSQGEQVTLLSHPAYILLTGGLFYLFGSGEVLARLLPALAGSAVIVFPFIFRRQIGQKAALIAAFGLAIDPLLTATSRQAGSPMMAVGFVALAIWLWQREKPLGAGIFAALFLLSGPSAVLGLLVAVFVLVALYFMNGRQWAVSFREITTSQPFLVGGVLGLAACGTLFMLYPEGLAALLQAFPDYISTWVGAVSIPMGRSLFAIPVYSPFAAIFGFIAISRLETWEEKDSKPFAFWLLIGLLFALLNPGRQIADLVWVIVPLWLLAAAVAGEFLKIPEREDRVMVLVGAVFVLVLLFYWLINISMMSQQYGVFFPPDFGFKDLASLDANTKLYLMRLVITIFVPLLILLLMAVVYTSWPGEAAFQATTWGVGIFLLFYLVSAAFGFTDDRTKVAGEFWVGQSSPGYVEEIRSAVEEASLQIVGNRTEVDLVYLVDSSLLHWTFRDFPNARYQAVVDQAVLPSMILNQDFTFGDTTLGHFYRGQTNVLNFYQAWEGAAIPADFDRWLLYRVSPLEKEWVVIWTRADLFPLYSPPDASPLE